MSKLQQEYVDTVLDRVTRARYAAIISIFAYAEPQETSLDIGCFVGKFTSMLPCPAIGVDINQDYIDYANKHFKTCETQFYRLDGRRLPWKDDSFYTTYCLEVLEHVDEPDAIFREAVRVTKKDGFLVFCVPSPNQSKAIDPEHLHDFQHDWFEERMHKPNIYQLGKNEMYTVYIARNVKEAPTG